ncbi:MAG: RtcB family protein [Phycisphaerae bacterium]|nr:RtcB family protein [Phycisphaerae bacterium]
MDTGKLRRISEYRWELPRCGEMNVDGVIFATPELLEGMDEKVCEQVSNVAKLPGIVGASYAMPDAHWGYGFCIGGVAAFDPDKGGVISAGGVGFDISCGIRTLNTGLTIDDIGGLHGDIGETLFNRIPAGVGSTGKLRLKKSRMDDVLAGGAKWAVDHGYGTERDLRFIEEHGCMAGADPGKVSDYAKQRQESEVGTLGSGNHYLEVQRVDKIYDKKAAQAFGIREGDIKISIHCGSRGLGHQIGTEFLKKMVTSAPSYGLTLPDRELACSPINSKVGQDYLGAMRAGINCAMANRQVLTHLVRQAFDAILPKASISLMYDVSHNTCKLEEYVVEGKKRKLYVHRKGATRAFGPGHGGIPAEYKHVGQPVLIGGTMGTASHILAGTAESESLAFASACHGAGRNMSRRAATKKWQGREMVDKLRREGIIIRSRSMRGVAEESPGAYKDVDAVVDAADKAKLAKKVARLVPLICVKG